MVCNELSIEPLRSAVLALCPDIDAACKIRNDTVIGMQTRLIIYCLE